MKIKSIGKISLLTLLSLATHTTLANPLNYFNRHITFTNPINYFSQYHPTILMQAGVFDASQGESARIGIVNAIGNDYTLTQQHDRNFLVGLGVFTDGVCSQWVNTMYGINAFYLAPTAVKGYVVQETVFTNLAYRYSVENYPIYADVRFLINNGLTDQYNVTFDLGLGANIIRTSDYSENSLDGGVTIPDQAFKGKTTIGLSGMVGVGLRFNNVFNHTPVECGYRFFYLGRGELDKTTNQLLGTIDTGNNSYANALICSVAV